MEIHATGKDIRARKPLEAELCTVGSATNRFHLGRHPILLHGTKHNIYDMHVGVDFLLHVVILVVNSDGNGAFAIFLVHLFDATLHEILAVFELFAVVITNDIVEFCLLGAALYAQQMIETLVAFGGFWDVGIGYHAVKFARQTVGIHHLSLGIARVNAHAFDGDFGTSRIEILIFQVA